jgi:ABC-type nitrate/sulfonate/bicarbonate transport system permease component
MIALLARRLGLTLLSLVCSFAALLVIWQVAVRALDVNPYIAKTPTDVWHYLSVDAANSTAADHRSQLLRLLWVTLSDAGIGFLFGVLSSVALAVLFAVARPLEAMFMPLAMLMRTMPLVGFAPIIYIIFGDGALCVAIIGLIIVFFPVLINMTAGLRSARAESMDVVSVYGGGKWTAVRMVALPTALPNFFASLKIAVPGSLVGAMLYEWLFSLKGLGGEINVANASALYSETWTIVVLVTGVSILLYNVVVVIESPVLARWGPDAGRYLDK